MPDTVARPTVHVVEDDESLRGAIEALVGSVGVDARGYPSARAFLDLYQRNGPGCVLSDVRMPGMSGLELQAALRARGIPIPVILMTSFADVSLAVAALRAGVRDLIQKPFGHQDLLDRLNAAVTQDEEEWRQARHRDAIKARVARLSAREREVFERVVRGRLNKVIADELDLSLKSVELHRAHVMEKMEVDSLAELVRMAVVLEAGP